ncbi:hypothetical protein U1Q18_020881 [Sarracenia purpurea var. burkii]
MLSQLASDDLLLSGFGILRCWFSEVVVLPSLSWHACRCGLFCRGLAAWGFNLGWASPGSVLPLTSPVSLSLILCLLFSSPCSLCKGSGACVGCGSHSTLSFPDRFGAVTTYEVQNIAPFRNRL